MLRNIQFNTAVGGKVSVESGWVGNLEGIRALDTSVMVTNTKCYLSLLVFFFTLINYYILPIGYILSM